MKPLTRDEALDRPLRRASLAALPPAYLQGGVVTAANMAAEGDGAAALLIASADRASALGLVPKARFLSFATAGEDPALWPMAAVPATLAALAASGLSSTDVDRWYVHESSAAAVLAWAAALGIGLDKINVDGGELATTAPVGAVGAGLFAAAVGGLAASSNGFAVVCGAGDGGVGTACVLARCQ
jgi:acetyl-CoA acetyltransferase